jgi:hypothetical protein
MKKVSKSETTPVKRIVSESKSGIKVYYIPYVT